MSETLLIQYILSSKNVSVFEGDSFFVDVVTATQDNKEIGKLLHVKYVLLWGIYKGVVALKKIPLKVCCVRRPS